MVKGMFWKAKLSWVLWKYLKNWKMRSAGKFEKDEVETKSEKESSKGYLGSWKYFRRRGKKSRNRDAKCHRDRMHQTLMWN